MKNKLLLFLSIIVCLTLIAGYSYTSKSAETLNKANSEEKLIELATGHAMSPYYANVLELENEADLIVKGKLEGEGIVKDFKQGGVIIDSATLSTFKVNKVFKGDLQSKKTIKVYEPAAKKGNIYVNTEGYKLMDNSGEYILFLQRNPEGIYIVQGIHQGKFDLNKGNAKLNNQTSFTDREFEKYEYLGEEIEHFNKLKKEVVNKYQ